MDCKIKVGIIGGTGLDSNVDIIKDSKKIELAKTPFGDPSDKFATVGQIHGVDIVILGRHGEKHDKNPSNVNYRANIWTFKQLGCTHVLATTACGSLKLEVRPETFAILDQYIDRTTMRQKTFYRVSHIPQAFPFDRTMQKIIEGAMQALNIPYTPRATCVAIEGPRYSTFAESKLYQSWGCDIVNMTAVPEVPLAAEAGLVYASIAMVTDYDCWKEGEEAVTVELVDQRMAKIKEKIQRVLPEVLKRMSKCNWDAIIKERRQQAKAAIMAE